MSGNPCDDFRAVVAADLGAAPDRIEPGKRYRFSVNGKPGDSAGWCLLNPDSRVGWYGDFRTHRTGFWQRRLSQPMPSRAELAERERLERIAAEKFWAVQAAERAQRAPALNRQWGECLPVADGDPVSLYLRQRLAVPEFQRLNVPAALRLHPEMPYFHDGKRAGPWPAMVAELTAADGARATLHKTWVTKDGFKAPTFGPAKKLAPACGIVVGGCIRLVTPSEWSGDLLAIAEGIETALAARILTDFPTVAAYSAGALAAWIWPKTLRKLVIFADHDDAGARAAVDLKERARAGGLWVEVLTPTRSGEDWCDVLVRRRRGERK